MKVTKGIEWIITCTDNFEDTVAFFRDVMGLAVRSEGVPTTDKQFTRFAQIEMPNGVVLEIVEPEAAFRTLYAVPVMCITVDDVAQARQEMEDQRVEFVAPIFTTEAGWGWTYFRAPDGHVHQIQGPIERTRCAAQHRANNRAA